MAAAVNRSNTTWLACARRAAILVASIVVLAPVVRAAPAPDDCPCGHPRSMVTPAHPTAATRISMLALSTTPGAGFLVSTDADTGANDVPPITAGRVTGEVFAALASGFVGGALSAYVAYGVLWSCTSDECTAGAIGAAFAGYATIIALGVKAAGSAGDQHVPLTYPFLGAVAGAAIGFPLFFAATNGSTDGEAGIVTALLLPPAGAVIGAIAGRQWDDTALGSLRILSAPTTPSAWSATTAPGPLAGTQVALASVSF